MEKNRYHAAAEIKKGMKHYHQKPDGLKIQSI